MGSDEWTGKPCTVKDCTVIAQIHVLSTYTYSHITSKESWCVLCLWGGGGGGGGGGVPLSYNLVFLWVHECTFCSTFFVYM